MTDTAEQNIPQPKATEAPPQVLIAEGPRDNKNRMIARLKNIGTIVGSVNQEQSKGMETHPFHARAAELVKLGMGYTSYLETHIDEIPDDRTFQAIASLAKTSLLMNIEQYVSTIKSVGGYVAQNPELNDLNPPGIKDGPWSNIKEALYYSSNNDLREQYREGILAKAQESIQSGEFSPRDVDHLERFLVDPQGRMPSEFIPQYVEEHGGEIQQWTPLSLEDFQEHVITRIGTETAALSENSYLKQLDEEIASIKPKNLQESKTLAKIKYVDREKKLAFIRDLRFGRANVEKVKEDVARRAAEISRRPDLRTLAPHLRQFFPPFLETLKSTAGSDLELRRSTLNALLQSYSLTPEAMKAVMDYLQLYLK